jgi:hypothetical protein
MPTDYAAAAYPDPWQILGVQLRPFSLGHLLKLRKLGNAFAADDAAEAHLGDLLLAILVCAMPSHPDPLKDEFWAWLNRPVAKWRTWCPWLFHQFTPAELFILKWGRRCRGVDLKERAELFQKYIQTHSEMPGYWNESKSTRTSGAHWSHSVLATLVSRCGYTQEEAYNVPIIKALNDYFKWAETEGHLTLMSAEELEATSEHA